MRVKVRQRGCCDRDMLLSLIYSFCSGGGHLAEVDALGADAVARQLTGRAAVPDSRRPGEFLAKMHEQGLQGLRTCVRHLNRCIAPLFVRDCLRRYGYVPVCVDGTGIEVQGRCFEEAHRGYNGERQ